MDLTKALAIAVKTSAAKPAWMRPAILIPGKV
jgi:hypothetical protein